MTKTNNFTTHSLVIITPSDGEPPFVYFIKDADLTAKIVEDMEYQTGDYPYWCLQSEDPEDPPCVFDIEKRGERACPVGSALRRSRKVSRIFSYCC